MTKYLYGVLTGTLLTLIIGVFAVQLYNAKEIEFLPSNSNWNVFNVNDALNDLYQNQNVDQIVGTWMNDHYVDSLTWSSIVPSYYNQNYLEKENNAFKVKVPGKYRIYYQVASDCLNSSCRGYIRLLINNNVVGSCSSYYARCDNKEIYYETELKVDDIIKIEVYTTSASYGVRAVANVIKLAA